MAEAKTAKSKKKPRGRPRLGEEARQGLIDAACVDLEEGGLENLNARSVAARAGVAVGTIYKYFDDLHDLVRYANGQTYDELATYQKKMLAREKTRGGDATKQLLALARGYLEFVRKHPNRWSATLAFNSQQTAPPDWYRAKEYGLLVIVEEALISLPGLKDRKQRLRTAMALWASVHGIIVIAMSGGFERGGVDEAMKQAAIVVGPVVQEFSG